MLRVAEDWHIPIEEIRFGDNNDERVIEIVAGQMIVMTVSALDAQAEDLPLATLAEQWKQATQTAVYDYRENRTLHKLIWQFLKAVLLTGAIVWFFSLIGRFDDYCHESLQNRNT